jgi:hypothetical protein
MRRPRRELVIFSLSALDVLAMTTGVFVLLLVLVMPYYRKTLDGQAEIERMRAATAEAAEDVRANESLAASNAEEAAEARKSLARLQAEAAALRERAAKIHRTIPTTAPPAPQPQPVPAAPMARTTVIEALDLVFVIDTTASMTPAIRELGRDISGVVRILEKLVPSLRVGIAAYADSDSGVPPVISLPLTPTDRYLPRISAFIDAMRAAPIGSRTVEEDMHLGLQSAMAMALRPYARQIIIVIGDAAAHPEVQEETLYRLRTFARSSPLRTVSALFVATPAAQRVGLRDRAYFVRVAEAGGGSFHDHAGSMLESVLLSVLIE